MEPASYFQLLLLLLNRRKPPAGFRCEGTKEEEDWEGFAH